MGACEEENFIPLFPREQPTPPRSRMVPLGNCLDGYQRERKMTKKLGSVLGWIANVLHAHKHGRNLQRHGDLAHQFALVAPLGGGAMVALQALQLPDRDPDRLVGAQPRRGRPPWGWTVAPQL